MRVAAALVANDMRRHLRSGFLVGVGVVVPLGLAFVFSLVFGGSDDDRLDLPTGVLDQDGSPASAALLAQLDALDDAGILAVEHLAAGTDPAAEVEDGDLAAVVVVPAGFGEATTWPGGDRAVGPGSGDGPSLRVVASADRPISSDVVRSVVERLAAGFDAARIEAVAAQALGVDPPGAGPPEVALVPDERPRLSPTSFITASTAALFLYFVALLGVTGLLEERRDGTLPRILAGPVRRSSVLGAKVVVTVLSGVASVGVLLVAARFLMGAEWAAPGGVALLVVAMALAVAGLTLLVTGTARTPESAANLQSVLGIVLTMLGGWLISLPDDGLLGLASRLSPNRWFLDGLAAATEEASWTAVLPGVAVLVGFAVVLGIPGLVLVQRRLSG